MKGGKDVSASVIGGESIQSILKGSHVHYYDSEAQAGGSVGF